MYIKIYFNDKPLFLCDEMTSEIKEYAHHDDAVMIDDFSHPAVNSMIHEMRQPKVHAGIFVHKDFGELRKAFWKKFLLVKAGGGLVHNREEKYLFMLRRGVWDLPKGKLDPGETIEHCAIREVMEETGIGGVIMEGPLLITYHTYDESGKHILKETHWFRMQAPAPGELTPQSEEQITELRWVDADGMKVLLRNTFPSIKDVIKAAAGLSPQ
ncbi:MAG TPA: NUDIX domain-containing protein [Puia sp.]|uniref:NUDIX hydrolase n=1 Tax=Puia sp. TaxID=2045100 RepID=UPI002C8C3FFC|nr:NUDIX domain-containing protein [Puia sp.]HVU94676.1 NUDIX domain-containing protein [Puia sp.]